jgi:hypothetical protein
MSILNDQGALPHIPMNQHWTSLPICHMLTFHSHSGWTTPSALPVPSILTTSCLDLNAELPQARPTLAVTPLEVQHSSLAMITTYPISLDFTPLNNMTPPFIYPAPFCEHPTTVEFTSALSMTGPANITMASVQPSTHNITFHPALSSPLAHFVYTTADLTKAAHLKDWHPS